MPVPVFLRRVSVLAGALALLGCASRPSEAPVFEGAPDHWATGEATGGAIGESTRAIDELWWESFDDPRLNALIIEAQTENPRLLQAAARTDQAFAQARIAGADRWPQASGSFSASKQKQSLAGFPPALLGGQTSSKTENFGLSLNVSWELDLWGRIAAQHAATREDFLASSDNLRAVRQSVAGQTAKTYFAVIEAREQVELAQRTVTAFEETSRQVANRVDAGIKSPTDKLLAISNLETARAGLQQRRDAHQLVARQLETLLRDYPAGDIETPERLPDAPATPPAGLPADLLERRPDLLAAERSLRAAGLRTTAARRALLPPISLTGSTGQQSSELSDLLDGDFSVWSIAGSLAQPIFQGGRLRANIALSKAREREAAEAYAEAALNAFSEVEAALAADAFLAARETSLKAASEAAVEAERIAFNRYEQGVTPFLTVLESQQRALDTRSAYIAARRARLDNRIDLHLALGGGFESSNEEEFNVAFTD